MIAAYELPFLLTAVFATLGFAAAFMVVALARLCWRYTESRYKRDRADLR